MPKISLQLAGPVQFAHADSELRVEGQGTLIFSKGSVEWRPLGNKTNLRRYTWKQFAAHLEAGGKPAKIQDDGTIKRVVRKKPAK